MASSIVSSFALNSYPQQVTATSQTPPSPVSPPTTQAGFNTPSSPQSPTVTTLSKTATGFSVYEKDSDYGYMKLAGFMAEHPEAGAFKRFGDLNAFNLLALQSELCYLREDFQEAVKEAQRQTEKPVPVDRSLYIMRSEGSETQEIILQIREKLKEYSKSICPISTEQTLLKSMDPSTNTG